MIKTMIFALGLSLLSGTASAQARVGTHCILWPILYVGNVHVDLDRVAHTFQVRFDDVSGKSGVMAQGQWTASGRDSMGFELISLCTGQPCSGPTFLASFKVAEQINGRFQDRASYLSVNSQANIKLQYIHYGRVQVLGGLSEFRCAAM